MYIYMYACRSCEYGAVMYSVYYSMYITSMYVLVYWKWYIIIMLFVCVSVRVVRPRKPPLLLKWLNVLCSGFQSLLQYSELAG